MALTSTISLALNKKICKLQSTNNKVIGVHVHSP